LSKEKREKNNKPKSLGLVFPAESSNSHTGSWRFSFGLHPQINTTHTLIVNIFILFYFTFFSTTTNTPNSHRVPLLVVERLHSTIITYPCSLERPATMPDDTFEESIRPLRDERSRRKQE
jgi:hypothetical protein